MLAPPPFSGIAAQYDGLYWRPPDVVDKMVRALGPYTGHTLEIGAGTGQGTTKLRAAGFQIIASDESFEMLAELRRKAPQIPCIQANARALPFAGHSFDLTLALRVLHVVSDWQTVIGELTRVLRPGKILVIELPLSRSVTHGQILERVWNQFGQPKHNLGISGLFALDAYAKTCGLRPIELSTIRSPYELTIEQMVDRCTNKLIAALWRIPYPKLRASRKELKTWANAKYGDLATRISVNGKIQWRAYRTPS